MSADETTTPETTATPLLRVVKGDPTPAQLAALVAVVAARAVSGVEDRPQPRSEWGHPVRLHRQPLRIGPGVWRQSAW